MIISNIKFNKKNVFIYIYISSFDQCVCTTFEKLLSSSSSLSHLVLQTEFTMGQIYPKNQISDNNIIILVLLHKIL